MEDFYFEESNTKHILIKCLIFLFIIGVGIGAFLFHRKENTIKLKNIKMEVGTELSKNINDYLINGHNNSDQYKLDLNNVDTNKVGTYTYKIKYKKHVKKGKITVRDTKGPKAVLDNITIGVKEEFNSNLLLVSCEDLSLPCSISFKNDKDKELLNKVGEYNILFNVSDSEGNITELSSLITVSETDTLSSKMTNDLEYYTNSENDDKIKHVFFRKFDNAIFEDSLEFEGIIQEISAIDFSKYTNQDIYSNKLIIAYNKYGYVVGIQVELTFDDGTKTLIEDKEINNEEE